MIKDDSVYIGHMLDFARQISVKTKDIDKINWEADENLRLAIVLLVQNIGESAIRVSKQTIKDNSSIPWKEIIGMRHRIVHNYVKVRHNIVWDVAKYEIPELIKELEKIISDE